MGSENVRGFTRREHTTAHVALLTRMISGPKNFFEHLGPILHGLIVHLQDHMFNDRWSDAFVCEDKMNGPIAAVEFEDGPDRCAHLLALHVGGVTRNTQSQESNKGRNHCVVSAGAARLPLFRHGADHIAGWLSVNQRSVLLTPLCQAPNQSINFSNMKSFTEHLWFEVPARRGFINITPKIEELIHRSGVTEGLCLVNAMHITASIFVNDDEAGLHHDYEVWLEKLAPHAPTNAYRHNRTGEDNADAHLKRQIMGREAVVAITKGKLDFGPWEQIFYGEFDGRRKKRVLVKIIGE